MRVLVAGEMAVSTKRIFLDGCICTFCCTIDFREITNYYCCLSSLSFLFNWASYVGLIFIIPYTTIASDLIDIFGRVKSDFIVTFSNYGCSYFSVCIFYCFHAEANFAYKDCRFTVTFSKASRDPWINISALSCCRRCNFLIFGKNLTPSSLIRMDYVIYWRNIWYQENQHNSQNYSPKTWC